MRLSQTSDKIVAELARELGVNVQTLHDGRRQAMTKRQLPVPDADSLEQKVKRLEMEPRLVSEERDIVRSRRLLCPASAEVGTAVLFAFMREHEAKFSIESMCRVFGVSFRGYYAHWVRPESERARQDRTVAEEIETVFHAH